MATLILAIIMVIVVCLLIYAIDQIPMPAPLPIICKVAVILVGVLVILHQSGML